MRAKRILDDIEQRLQSLITRSTPVGRFLLLDWMSMELNELTGKADWDWAKVHLDPAVRTASGTRFYALPRNFPENFCFGDQSGSRWICKLDDGNSEQFLDYLTPGAYYGQDFQAASNERPTHYTVITATNGLRQLGLWPIPNAAFSILGLYSPTDWGIDEESELPPVPGNSAILEYAVLRRLEAQTFEPLYQEALAYLLLRAAQNRKAQIVPWMGKYGNEYKMTSRM